VRSDYRRWQSDAESSEVQRVGALSAFVENDRLSGVFGVIDIVDVRT